MSLRDMSFFIINIFINNFIINKLLIIVIINIFEKFDHKLFA